ncbi:MAG: thioredoxin-disulfide reductase [Deltaproteobacteria bacterium]|nr:thioredoxin-disulfide reductase [Deltaproteobacteria bacterium]MBW1952995.1 thioredoxin-disulfide reductase [Deltaproteobacteria bacterium]MBW1985946.1 thioredoxin-disulfide reductase [Deltaproteobacteria bacterium]MBW2133706.1 thioredoxin-disulfide reductase [Deltaproteobacteria bacterium]
MKSCDYDLVIVGGGPAGLTAGIYAGRARIKTVLIEKLITGGQVMTSELVENYPGFPDGVSGFELSQRMRDQAERFGLEIINDEVLELKPGDPCHTLVLAEQQLTCQAVIIASGVKPNQLGIPGEEALTGRGVSYCATCDGALYRDEVIAGVGGGDTALQDSIFLTRFAQKVHLIHRRDAFRGSKILQERVLANDKIEVHWDTVVQEIQGDKSVQAVRLKNVKTGQESTLPVSGVFLWVGITPATTWLRDVLDLDDWGFIITDDEMATNRPGIFAAGDVRSKMLRQISTAVGDGATATFAVEKYLEHRQTR